MWADGRPDNVNKEDKLSMLDLLKVSVNHVVQNYCIPNGFMIESARAEKLGSFPNLIFKKDGVKYAAAVVTSIYPIYVGLNDDARLLFVKKCAENNVIPLFAPVGIKSTDEARANAGLVLSDDTFNIVFNGFIKLNSDKVQDLRCKRENIFLFK